jgi:hypothetical protein
MSSRSRRFLNGAARVPLDQLFGDNKSDAQQPKI